MMTKWTSQRLPETVQKVMTMQSGHIKLTSPNGFYGYTESIGSSLLRIINLKLTVLFAWLMPSQLTFNKHYISQDSDEKYMI